MRAMVLHDVFDLSRTETPLRLEEVKTVQAAANEVRIKVVACAVCHTELDEIEGRTPPPSYPCIPGHQVIGHIDQLGHQVDSLSLGERVGVGWIFSACGYCEFCQQGLENLCPEFKATGRDRNGGYAEYLCVPAGFAIPIPAALENYATAPLLCAGAIGYRSLMLAGIENGERLGLTGFGASGHLVLQLARHLYPDSDIYVFSRNKSEQRFALDLGASWAGATDSKAPHQLHAIIDTTPAWFPVLCALQQLQPRGRLVINAIRKEDGDIKRLLELDYSDHLWMEKEIKSVANITRADIVDFLDYAAEAGIESEYQCFELEEANRALMEIKHGKIRGAKVLRLS